MPLGWGLVDDTPNSFVWEIGHMSDFSTLPGSSACPGQAGCGLLRHRRTGLASARSRSNRSPSPMARRRTRWAGGQRLRRHRRSQPVLPQLRRPVLFLSVVCLQTAQARAFTYGADYPGTQFDYGQAAQFATRRNAAAPVRALTPDSVAVIATLDGSIRAMASVTTPVPAAVSRIRRGSSPLGAIPPRPPHIGANIKGTRGVAVIEVRQCPAETQLPCRWTWMPPLYARSKCSSYSHRNAVGRRTGTPSDMEGRGPRRSLDTLLMRLDLGLAFVRHLPMGSPENEKQREAVHDGNVSPRRAGRHWLGHYCAFHRNGAQGGVAPRDRSRFIVPFPPGGGTDPIARITQTKLIETTGWQIVVEKQAGCRGG